MTYKEALSEAMTDLGSDPKARAIGYGMKINGGGGTFKDWSSHQVVETTVAENLMIGIATGLSLKGYRPLVFIERMDFILNAMDALVNHLDKLELLSRGQFAPHTIIRVVVGNKSKPLFTGPTHCQNFSRALSQMLSFPVVELTSPLHVQTAYQDAKMNWDNRSTMLIEHKDLW